MFARATAEIAAIRTSIPADDPRAVQKIFAVEHAPRFTGPLLTLAHRVFRGYDAFDETLAYVLKRLHTATQLEQVRELATGVRWDEF